MPTSATLLSPWALWTGEHALAIFLAVLGLLLAATAAVCWALRRYAARRRQAALIPALPQRLRAEVGFAIVLIGAGVFAALAALIAAGGIPGWSDQAFTEVLRASVPDLALQVFAALTHLGDTNTLAALCIAIARPADCLRLALGYRIPPGPKVGAGETAMHATEADQARSSAYR